MERSPATTAPPRRERRRARLRERLRHPAAAPLAVLAGGAAGAAYLWHTDPHEEGRLLPACPFRWATGLLCPACGGTRMAYDLLHGDVAAALHDNAALLLLGAPLAGWLGARWLYEGLRGRRYRPRLAGWRAAAVLGTAVGWAVLRNVLATG